MKKSFTYLRQATLYAATFCLLMMFLLLTHAGMAQGSWKKKADWPGGSALSAGVFSIGSKIYVCSGVNFNEATRIYSKSVWVYDVNTNVWSQVADLPGEQRSSAVAFSVRGKGYIGLGGGIFSNTRFRDFLEYDPVTNDWTSVGNYPGAYAPASLAFSVNGKAYVLLSAYSDSGAGDLWEFEPLKRKWTKKAPYPLINPAYITSFVISNKAYVGTGASSAGFMTKDFFEYDPALDKWTRKANFGGDLRHSAVGFSMDGKGYMGTGGANHCNCMVNDVWVYNPTVDVWAQVADLPGSIGFLVKATSAGGKGFMMFGNAEGNTGEKDVFVYTPDNLTEQKIILPDTVIKTAIAPDFTPPAIATSGLPIIYTSSDTVIATIVNNKVHIKNAGYCYITAKQAGNSAYRPANDATTMLLVQRAPQTITFAPLPPTIVGPTEIPLTATASSNLPVYYSSDNTSVAFIWGGKIRISGVGTANITAYQYGSDKYLDAPPQTQTLTVSRQGYNIANLKLLEFVPTISRSAVPGPSDYNYTANVPNGTATIRVKPTATDTGAVIKVMGITVASGTPSAPIALNVGANVININVTAADGVTTKSYTVTITRAASNIANLRLLELVPAATRAMVSGPADYNYTASVPFSTAGIQVKPTATDTTAVIKVMGATVRSEALSGVIPLNVGANTINITATAADGITTKTYAITVTRAAGANNALLSRILFNPSASIINTAGPADFNRSATVPAGTTKVTVAATTQDANATVKINGTIVLSGKPSASIPLNAGSTLINIQVTAEDGATTKVYAVTVNRAAAAVTLAFNAGKATFVQPESPRDETVLQGVKVYRALSPNGDGINDNLVIEGINAYPKNTVKVMDMNGNVVFEKEGYNNNERVFDGHSSKGLLLQAGTYFYSVEYKNGDQRQHSTGYLIIKY
jgi:gliding motility-associated-like protein